MDLGRVLIENIYKEQGNRRHFELIADRGAFGDQRYATWIVASRERMALESSFVTTCTAFHGPRDPGTDYRAYERTTPAYETMREAAYLSPAHNSLPDSLLLELPLLLA